MFSYFKEKKDYDDRLSTLYTFTPCGPNGELPRMLKAILFNTLCTTAIDIIRCTQQLLCNSTFFYEERIYI